MKAKSTKQTNVLSMARPGTPRESEGKLGTFDGPEARLNVTLPIPVHQRVKVRAAQSRQTIREYILQLLAKDGIEME